MKKGKEKKDQREEIIFIIWKMMKCIFKRKRIKGKYSFVMEYRWQFIYMQNVDICK